MSIGRLNGCSERPADDFCLLARLVTRQRQNLDPRLSAHFWDDQSEERSIEDDTVFACNQERFVWEAIDAPLPSRQFGRSKARAYEGLVADKADQDRPLPRAMAAMSTSRWPRSPF